MRSRLAAFSFLAALAAVTAACSTKEADDVASTSSDQDLRLLDTTLLGSIGPGQTKASCIYAPPNRSAWDFTAHAGDVITVTVGSHVGDAVGYITDSRYAILAYNDDADPSTHDARVLYQAVQSGDYRIVFEDYNHRPATFDVSLQIVSGTTTDVCNYGGNTYANGDTFPASDGCNTCSCADTSVTCGHNVCACNPGSDGLDYYGDVPWCKQTRYNCPLGQVRFSNDCGCGCETLTTTHRPRSSP